MHFGEVSYDRQLNHLVTAGTVIAHTEHTERTEQLEILSTGPNLHPNTLNTHSGVGHQGGRFQPSLRLKSPTDTSHYEFLCIQATSALGDTACSGLQ